MHPNERLLREEYRARADRDDQSLAAVFSNDVVWHVPGRNAIAGEYRGKDQVLEYVHRRRALVEDTFEVTVEDVLANDEHGLVIARGSAVRDGKRLEWRAHGLYRFESGRIAECWVLPEDQSAFDAVWSLRDVPPKDRWVDSQDESVDVPDAPQPEASGAWARFYNEVGTRFAVSVAPRIRELFEATRMGSANKTLLDVCCGTGQLARHFLDHGYQVTGLDLSEAMLDYARLNAGSYVTDGTARFIRADASDFHVREEFGLATSTFDALNLLQTTDALRRCFRCVHSAVTDGGLFVFDLMTRCGFWRDYNGQWVDDTPRYLYVYRSIYDGGRKAQSRMVGFVRTENGQWERFDEYRTPTFFSATEVTHMLQETGWRAVTVTATDDLDTSVDDPETVDRVFFIAQR